MAKKQKFSSWSRCTRQLQRTTSTNRGVVAALLSALCIVGCEFEVEDPATSRARLGTVAVGYVHDGTSGSTVQNDTIRGNVSAFDTIDTVWTVDGLGSFDHFLEVLDATGRRHRFYYSLPGNVRIQVDSGMSVVARLATANGGFNLTVITPQDSLVCLFGTMPFPELSGEIRHTGRQGFAVSLPDQAARYRNTECGREGDYDLDLAWATGSVRIPPAGLVLLTSGRTYLAANVVNTRIVKTVKSCPGYTNEFAYMIVRQ